MFPKWLALSKHSVNINYYFIITYNLSLPFSPSKNLRKINHSLFKCLRENVIDTSDSIFTLINPVWKPEWGIVYQTKDQTYIFQLFPYFTFSLFFSIPFSHILFTLAQFSVRGKSLIHELSQPFPSSCLLKRICHCSLIFFPTLAVYRESSFARFVPLIFCDANSKGKW